MPNFSFARSPVPDGWLTHACWGYGVIISIIRHWPTEGNTQLRVNTKLKVYQMYLLCTLLYCSESLTTYARQENCLENFHLCCIYQILSIIWQNKMEEKIAGESSFPQHALYALSMLSAFSWTCAPYG